MAFHIHMQQEEALQIALEGDLDIISASEMKTKVLDAYEEQPSD